jgi:TatA/E family protein of Tat protein translocase
MMGLGMTEVILILVIALIIFGPRKLPELGKSMGQAMFQFRRASDDFKRTWEQEVEYEKVRKDGSQSTSASYDYNSSESNDPYNPYSDSETAQLSEQSSDNAVNPSSSSPGQDQQTAGATAETPAPAKSPEKQHWI